MCGRYTITRDEMNFVSRFADKLVRLYFAPRYNIAPTQKCSVILLENSRLTNRDMIWGMQPSWAKTPLINAQSETIHEKPTFRKAFQTHRCLIPADSFYEWKTTGTAKQPMRISQENGESFCFAGLWHRELLPVKPGETVVNDIDEEPPPSRIRETFVIITRAADDFMRTIHHRMPFIVANNHYDWWLEDGPRAEMYQTVIKSPCQEPLVGYAVSQRVNNARNDDVDCIKPATSIPPN